MKKIYFLFLTLTFAFLFTSCKKTAESIIDCVGESLLVRVTATPDAGNSKLINVSVVYSGTHTVQSIDWQFGDGSTKNTTTTSTTHTYTAVGTYEVKAKVHIKRGSATCSPEPKKSITVN
jgi:PKD repeat protein